MSQPMILASSVKVVSASVISETEPQTPEGDQPGARWARASRRISLTSLSGSTDATISTTPGSKPMGYTPETVGVRRSSTKGAVIVGTTPRHSLSGSMSNSLQSTTPRVSIASANVNSSSSQQSSSVAEMTEEERKRIEERRRSSLARRGSQSLIVCDVTVGDDKVTTKQSEIILEDEEQKPEQKEEEKKSQKCCVIL
ncbi:hypothetical protein ACHWQZ_G019001 [Mnemiopsis leidyi]